MSVPAQVVERQDERLQFQSQLDLEILATRDSQTSSSDEIKGRALDISYNGVLLSLTESMVFGEQVSLRFKSIALEMDFEIGATVRWIRRGDDELDWLVGCSFDESLSDDCVDAIANAGCVDRRKWPRNEAKVRAGVQLPGKPDSLPVVLLDYSSTGVRFASFELVEPNLPIKLALTDRDGNSIQVKATSQWTASCDSGYLVGCHVSGMHQDLFDKWQNGLRNESPNKSSRPKHWKMAAAFGGIVALLGAISWFASQ